MADWYVSSANYAAVPVWAATTAYTVGQFVKPVVPAVQTSMVFRCTTAGTSGASEPVWTGALSNNLTIVSGGVTFTNVSGQSAYGWSAAAGTLYVISGFSGSGNNRNLAGDRVFIASDHSETLASGTPTYQTNNATHAFGLVQFISVNRAGSVPPVAADAQPGASITITMNAVLTLEPYCDAYWEGISFTHTAAAQPIHFANGGLKAHYFKNGSFALTANSATPKLTCNNPAKVTFDNTTVRFGHVGQFIGGSGYPFDLLWLNTPSALAGAIFPSVLFSGGVTSGTCLATCRGIDLSALTGTLVGVSNSYCKALLDSCKVAASVTRLGAPAATNTGGNEVELVNCFDGINTLNERYTAAGAVTTDRSTLLTGGAQDDIGAYSLKLASSSRAEKSVLPLDCFAFDVENTTIGAAKTATVEIISSASSLNNDDISLLLEYMGTAGTSVVSFVGNLPSVLAPAAALPTSVATWNNQPASTWNPLDIDDMTLSDGNLIATSTSVFGAARATCSSTSKTYFELTMGIWVSSSTGAGIATPNFPVVINAVTIAAQGVIVFKSGNIWIDGSASGSTLGTRASGDVLGVAFDFAAKLFWVRVAPSGNWNGSGTANPATGVGGLSIGTLITPLFPCFATGVVGDAATLNAGASAFSGSVPAGFVSGFPILPNQKLQVTFTPQVAGRVRGLVRLGKVSTTVWVDPRIVIS